MENCNVLANYIVERLGKLEAEVERLKAERDALADTLGEFKAEVEEKKKTMKKYFSLASYTDGGKYIDHSYRREYVAEIAEFIGLTEKNEEEDEDE